MPYKFREVAEYTSLPGISHAAAANKPLSRAFWIIIVLATLSYTLYEMYYLLLRLQSKPMNAKITIKSDGVRRFPAVTICNRNAYKKSAIGQLPQLETLINAYHEAVSKYGNTTTPLPPTTRSTTREPEADPSTASTSTTTEAVSRNGVRKKRGVDLPKLYWLGGYVKNEVSVPVWDVSGLADTSISYSALDCTCDTGLYIDPTFMSSADCQSNCAYKMQCTPKENKLIPICRVEPSSTTCTNPCPTGLLHNGFCYYIKNCAAECAYNYADAVNFCASIDYGSGPGTLIHGVTDADMKGFLLPLIKEHYKARSLGINSQFSPSSDWSCCDGQARYNYKNYFTNDQDTNTYLQRSAEPCSGKTELTPSSKTKVEPPWSELCGVSTTTVSTTTTTTTPIPTTTVATLMPAQFSVGEVIVFLNLTNMKDGIAQQTTVTDAVPFVVGAITSEQRMLLGYQLEELIASCTFAGQQCDLKADFAVWNEPNLGNCFTFNGMHSEEPYFVSRAGTSTGLQLLVKVSQKEYLATSDTAGLKVYVHDPMQPIVSDSSGEAAAPGFRINFGLDYREIRRLRPPQGRECASIPPDPYYYEGLYSQEACMRSCYQKMVVDTCKCSDPRYPFVSNNDTDISSTNETDISNCAIDKRDCVDEVSAIYEKMSKKDTSCKCPWPCDAKDYLSTVSLTKLLPDQPFGFYVCDKNGTCGLSPTPASDVSLMSIYFNTMTFHYMEEEITFTLTNLWNEFNGLIGFTLGICVISLVELFFLVAVALCGNKMGKPAPAKIRLAYNTWYNTWF